LSRRQLILLTTAAAMSRCASPRETEMSGPEADGGWANGRSGARPDSAPTGGKRGEHSLGLGRRDGLLDVPEAYDPRRAAPLLLLLHGAGGTGARAMRSMQPSADRHGIILVAPDSARRTWDLIVTEE